MWGEDQLGPDGLLHLRGVPVGQQPVGREVLVHGAKLRAFGQLAPRARDSAGGVDHDARGLDQPGADQRRQGQGGGGHVAARRRPPAGRRPGRCGRARVGRTRRRPAAPGRCARRRTRSGTGRDPSAGNRRPGPRHGRPRPAARAPTSGRRRGAGRRKRGLRLRPRWPGWARSAGPGRRRPRRGTCRPRRRPRWSWR